MAFPTRSRYSCNFLLKVSERASREKPGSKFERKKWPKAKLTVLLKVIFLEFRFRTRFYSHFSNFEFMSSKSCLLKKCHSRDCEIKVLTLVLISARNPINSRLTSDLLNIDWWAKTQIRAETRKSRGSFFKQESF